MTGLPSQQFWNGQRVFLTGHTGFKGGWMALWLRQLGAEVCGYAHEPSTSPSLFHALRVAEWTQSHIGDVRDAGAMRAVFSAFDPTVVIHMAAQPLVREGYADPLGTYSTNIMGTANLLEIVRASPRVAATVIVTTDKCYENREQIWPYRETDRLGGRDPYSSSKACAELVVSAYWWSFFRLLEGQGLATVRAGNVIGGGDWSKDRLMPDLIGAFSRSQTAIVRRPEAVRPWQHVLDPLCGYLLAAEHISRTSGTLQTWNFGPAAEDAETVGVVAARLAAAWGNGARFEVRREQNAVHEATLLNLDHTKARSELNWRPRWPLSLALQATVDWSRAFYGGRDMFSFSQQQIQNYAHPEKGERTTEAWSGKGAVPEYRPTALDS
jgi:CDP-glucose 4,6-dehydratase